jgi:hypothetical protein
MSKRLKLALSILLLVGFLSGCSGESTGLNGTTSNTATTDQVLQEQSGGDTSADKSQEGRITDPSTLNVQNGSASDLVQTNEVETLAFGDTGQSIDMDMSGDNNLMVYSQCIELFNNYQDYEGKVVSIPGTYASYYYEGTDTTYYYVIVSDSTACCQTGLEFTFADGTDPSTVLNEFDPVTLTGVFSTYEEDGVTYATITV